MAMVVIFGDSNESWFGPATRRWCIQREIAQTADIAFSAKPSTFAQWQPGDDHWPWLAARLGTDTKLVVIGLGGNLIPGSAQHVAVISALIGAIAKEAPAARLVWRGPPPATAKTVGGKRIVASAHDKMLRYRKNQVLRTKLAELGFATFGAAKPALGHAGRVYIDVISLHAGGPRPLPGGSIDPTLGTPECLAYEKGALAAGGPALNGETPSSGPWTSFVVSKDAMAVHVHTQPALDLVHNHCGPKGIYG